ncbi:MAG: bifunctional DNA-formamidopyrimidine glycosylase/DNA-(apurinic or apyrimidinic site) lyase [bacterium]|nr:bifunctional DNA-formamidopyrimidine glycosylase/DNA-(apurinic or apyrimidinic site) lyase [bacterium]
MPELPEVETTVRGLQKEVVGLKIVDVWTDLNTKDKRKKDTVANTEFFKIFKKEVIGSKIISVERRAKNILINLTPTTLSLRETSKKTILVHLKMTGHLLYGRYKKEKNKWVPDEHDEHPLHDPYNRFVHVVFTLQHLTPSPSPSKGGGENTKKNIHLAFCDTRKFGKMTLLKTESMYETKHLKNIGPEPLDKNFTLETLKQVLSKKPNGKIKTVLMDQSVVAGVGNIYSDEILWRASVHPERKTGNLKNDELKLIFKYIKEILTKGIDFGGDSMSDYRNIYGTRGEFQNKHQAYRRTKEKCRRKSCNGVIIRKVINSRSGHFCNIHQI